MRSQIGTAIQTAFIGRFATNSVFGTKARNNSGPAPRINLKKHFARAIVLILFFATGTILAQQILNNDSVLKMVNAGLNDDIVVATIRSSPGSYSLTPDDLIGLKKQNISEKVLSAMIQKNAGGPPVPALAPVVVGAPLVDEVGIYFKDNNGKWTEVVSEVVNWKTGGVLKRLATDGIVKGDVNGHIQGKSSRNTVNSRLDFLIYAPEGVASSEYQLLRLHESGNGREFRSVTGGVFHASGGAQRDEIDFEAKKIAPRMYEIVLGSEVKKGEYGFLSPGALSSSNMASSGKMYTFQVIE